MPSTWLKTTISKWYLRKRTGQVYQKKHKLTDLSRYKWPNLLKWHIAALLHVENICFRPHQISNAQAHDISLPCKDKRGKIGVSWGNISRTHLRSKVKLLCLLLSKDGTGFHAPNVYPGFWTMPSQSCSQCTWSFQQACCRMSHSISIAVHLLYMVTQIWSLWTIYDAERMRHNGCRSYLYLHVHHRQL